MVAEQHLAALAAQLLRAEHVDDVGAWCPVLTFLALEAASAVSPTAMAAFGVRDPRFYIKAGHPSLVCIKTPLRLVWQASSQTVSIALWCACLVCT